MKWKINANPEGSALFDQARKKAQSVVSLVGGFWRSRIRSRIPLLRELDAQRTLQHRRERIADLAWSASGLEKEVRWSERIDWLLADDWSCLAVNLRQQLAHDIAVDCADHLTDEHIRDLEAFVQVLEAICDQDRPLPDVAAMEPRIQRLKSCLYPSGLIEADEIDCP